MPSGDSVSSVPIKQPEFDWNATNLSQEFSTFRRMCVSLLEDGPYSNLSGKQKVATLLNWLGRAAYQLHDEFEHLNIYSFKTCSFKNFVIIPWVFSISILYCIIICHEVIAAAHQFI